MILSVQMLVSVITTTFNRSRFIPELQENYLNQEFPHSKMEWIILDDSEGDEQKETEKLFAKFAEKVANIRYVRLSKKRPMGYKLNRLCEMTRGSIIIVMDDDDYYPPTRVSSVVEAFATSPKQIAGCSKVYMYFEDEDTVYCAGPYGDNHALNCTIAFRSSYVTNHCYDSAEVCAVERAFTNDFTEPMIQLDSRETILHIVHGENTFRDKKKIGLLERTNLTKNDFQ